MSIPIKAVAECVVPDCLIWNNHKQTKGQVTIRADGGVSITCKHDINYAYFAAFDIENPNPGSKILLVNKKYFKIDRPVANLAHKKRNVGSARRGKYSLCFLHGVVCPLYDKETGRGRCF